MHGSTAHDNPSSNGAGVISWNTPSLYLFPSLSLLILSVNLSLSLFLSLDSIYDPFYLSHNDPFLSLFPTLFVFLSMLPCLSNLIVYFLLMCTYLSIQPISFLFYLCFFLSLPWLYLKVLSHCQTLFSLSMYFLSLSFSLSLW